MFAWLRRRKRPDPLTFDNATYMRNLLACKELDLYLAQPLGWRIEAFGYGEGAGVVLIRPGEAYVVAGGVVLPYPSLVTLSSRESGIDNRAAAVRFMLEKR